MNLTDKEMLKAQELFAFCYKPAFDKEWKSKGDYNEAKRVAKLAVYKENKMLNDPKCYEFTKYFWTRAANYVAQFKTKDESKEVGGSIQQSYFDEINWMGCWRLACASGFVPFKEYMTAFLPEEKTNQWSSYKRHMEYEGFVFEESEFGWMVTFVKPEPKPEQPSNEIEFKVTRELVEIMVTETLKRLEEKMTGN